MEFKTELLQQKLVDWPSRPGIISFKSFPFFSLFTLYECVLRVHIFWHKYWRTKRYWLKILNYLSCLLLLEDMRALLCLPEQNGPFTHIQFPAAVCTYKTLGSSLIPANTSTHSLLAPTATGIKKKCVVKMIKVYILLWIKMYLSLYFLCCCRFGARCFCCNRTIELAHKILPNMLPKLWHCSHRNGCHYKMNQTVISCRNCDDLRIGESKKKITR